MGIDMKTVAIQQPNFFPSLRYFDKIKKADLFIFLDDAEFSKQSYTQRTKIRGGKWLTVPVKGRQHKQMINEIRIARNGWRDNHFNILRSVYKDAPHLQRVMDFLDKALPSDAKYYKLDVLNLWGVLSTSWMINTIPFTRVPLISSTQLNIKSASTKRLIDLIQAVDGDVYYSGRGAKDYQDVELFEQAGIKLEYQREFDEEFDLSIIDTLMNHGFEGTRRLLDG